MTDSFALHDFLAGPCIGNLGFDVAPCVVFSYKCLMRVSVWQNPGVSYPDEPPFHPSEPYPETAQGEVSSIENPVYRGVRELFRLHGFDLSNYGSQQWNPLGHIINPGDTVLIKPNLIKENHPRYPNGWVYMMTHGSVIRAVCDYAVKALNGIGRIIVADAPQTDSSFIEICKILKLNELADYYASRGIRFDLVDIRKFEWKSVNDVIVSRRDHVGDPDGYVHFDLGERSLFVGHPGEGHYYGADYDTPGINRHHVGTHHEYVISGSAVKCDVFINLPKLKTHKKTGATLSLKNLVGINGDKNYLPHYSEGTPEEGGDQFPDGTIGRSVEVAGLRTFRRAALSVPGVGPWAYRQAKRVGEKLLGRTSDVVRSGNWYGNDTAWRMCLDLNRILLYGNADGTFRETFSDRKKYLSIVDGIVAGDGDGPIDVDPVEAGVLALGTDPVCLDAVAAKLMGFDPMKLAVIDGGFKLDTFKLTEEQLETITVSSNVSAWQGRLVDIDKSSLMNFRPHFGWRGHIETDRQPVG